MQDKAQSETTGQRVVELGTWSVREEARKFWDYVHCDECVYFAKPFDVNGELSHIFAEKYVRNDLWLHVRWAQLDTGQAGNHYDEALIEYIIVDEPSNAFRELDSPVSAVNWHRSMLVDIPELVELPERFCLYSVRSVARLKRVKNGVDTGIKKRAFLPVGVFGSTDRENNLVFGLSGRDCAGKQIDQVPSELIKGGAETVDKISDRKGNFFGHGFRGNYENVLRSIRVIFFSDRIRVAFNPIPNLLLSRLEVKVSPSGFHVDVLN